MSPAKRRRKAQLARLAKLDANHGWLYLMKSPRRDSSRAKALWWNCIVPLGDKLERRKPGAWQSLDRCPTGKIGLLYNYEKRRTAQANGRPGAGAAR